MSEFWLGVTQTAIGSFLGFALGIGAFLLQQRVHSKSEAKAKWRAALDALNRLNMAAASNIETLANVKMQFTSDLAWDVEKVERATENIVNTPLTNRAEKYQDLRSLASSLQHFYVCMERIAALSPPDASEYSSLNKEMPPLSLFAHRAMGTMQKIEDVSTSRNTLISDFSREADDGLTEERLLHFSRMLTATGASLCNAVDQGMAFWLLVSDQIRAYMTHRAKGEPFIYFDLLEEVGDHVPKEDLVPSFREQLVTFEE
ncbi:hypothetical protein NUH88_06675 [Nisaea acidiphila]|uniref:Uncharacterized protein n=1 Tax=Nisaea acidiphila TaxID=1862145 RepID=A0A9J7B114_9PROT|nr:hypothetical protein [Nisaea acidiphila]UUX51373.1 hypothetical protein NUH88_06675 [Nisaea acidiphila]